jgi:hypothetical protein
VGDEHVDFPEGSRVKQWSRRSRAVSFAFFLVLGHRLFSAHLPDLGSLSFRSLILSFTIPIILSFHVICSWKNALLFFSPHGIKSLNINAKLK